MTNQAYRVIFGLAVWSLPALPLLAPVRPAAGNAVVAPAPPPGGAELLERAVKAPMLEPRETIALLRGAAGHSPRDPELWAALVRVLRVNRFDDDADRASRTALRHNPQDPLLLVERATLFPPAPALDVLAELARVPGHEEEARRLTELASLDIAVPDRWEGAAPYCQAAADRLLYLGRVDRAAAWIEEGLAKAPGGGEPDAQAEGVRRELRSRKAIVLALQGHYAEAMKLQEQCGFPQARIEGKYAGLGDVLLVKKQPDLAIASFGPGRPRAAAAADGADGAGDAGRPAAQGAAAGPDKPAAEEGAEDDDPRTTRDRIHVLAWANVRAKRYDRAEALLKPRADDLGARLLLLQAEIERGRPDDAKRLGDELAGALQLQSGSNICGDWPDPDAHPASLAPQYAAAISWLLARHPEKEQEIKCLLGDPNDIRATPPFQLDIVPTSRLLPKLRAAVAAAEVAGDEAAVIEARRSLTGTLAQARLYREAEREQAPVAAAAGHPARTPTVVGEEPFHWSVLRHKADADALFEKDPKAITRAESLLLDLDGTCVPYVKIGGRDWPPADEMVASLCQLGPGVLDLVFQRLEPTYTAQDRRPYVKIIEQVGGPQDVPVLISVLARLFPPPGEGNRRPNVQAAADDAVTEVPLNHCLEKLTGAACPETDRAKRVEFWLKWWDENAKRIVAAAEAGR